MNSVDSIALGEAPDSGLAMTFRGGRLKELAEEARDPEFDSGRSIKLPTDRRTTEGSPFDDLLGAAKAPQSNPFTWLGLETLRSQLVVFNLESDQSIPNISKSISSKKRYLTSS